MAVAATTTIVSHRRLWNPPTSHPNHPKKMRRLHPQYEQHLPMLYFMTTTTTTTRRRRERRTATSSQDDSSSTPAQPDERQRRQQPCKEPRVRETSSDLPQQQQPNPRSNGTTQPPHDAEDAAQRQERARYLAAYHARPLELDRRAGASTSRKAKNQRTSHKPPMSSSHASTHLFEHHHHDDDNDDKTKHETATTTVAATASDDTTSGPWSTTTPCPRASRPSCGTASS